MELTAKQKEGLNIIVERHRANAKYTVISGYCDSCVMNNNNYCSFYSVNPSKISISFCRYYTSSLDKLVE